jgi:hypothetical protein
MIAGPMLSTAGLPLFATTFLSVFFAEDASFLCWAYLSKEGLILLTVVMSALLLCTIMARALEILGVSGDSDRTVVWFSALESSGIPSEEGKEVSVPLFLTKSLTVTGLGGSSPAILDFLGVQSLTF